ncbi:AP-3 complex subunit delta [Aspergillus nanangensis]|uniref:AP-3 complex subunit delta n=1 Tax=Aspergillus nanangensis TaxID=2582783 RepID=A0AAD4CEU6_ASPNN|nr:AP-3 complex subunit delta [Aspergillus nanangensis]
MKHPENPLDKSLGFKILAALHNGSEEDYIQHSLRECKAEIKSQDMDKKATALLKLIYLEMFGYDMSWASFHVLEVMSSTKYLQKRSGYLAAVQSFRQDTEVLMLATNLLKKDLASSSIPNMSLPLLCLPSMITTSLAMSLLQDVLSRISHSHAAVRKKAVVCLYRLALVYPESLKLAWPKLKDRLMDDEEDGSVTTAVINVVCELGWRRPEDFLPLAPRFFELLVAGGNNWMAIKIIKLFATLTPLEPRLTRKLLRPLMNIIQSTTAMSLLYECINGIIQGGILDGDGGLEEQDEIASLCVGKLRGMLVTDSDPNLKYVALLAFNRIAVPYPVMVSDHRDVIMNCLEDADISIRLQALELVARIVTSDTLQPTVHHLLDQLRQVEHIEWGDSDTPTQSPNGSPSNPLPCSYRVEVINRILDICSYNYYSELLDFEWYVDVLIQLVKLLPSDGGDYRIGDIMYESENAPAAASASRIGSEIRNIAVRVKDVRMETTRAAETLILSDSGNDLFSTVSNPNHNVLGCLAWVVGEFSEHLLIPDQTLKLLIDFSYMPLSPRTISLCLQAIPKVLVRLISNNASGWNPLRKGETSLLLAQIIGVLDALASHPDLDVQERAIEFLEVMRLASDAVHSGSHGEDGVPPLLGYLLPSLFYGLELNPVSANAQHKVPLPGDLDLDQPLNSNIRQLFQEHDKTPFSIEVPRSLQDFYYIKDTPTLSKQQAEVPQFDAQSGSYQKITEGLFQESTTWTKRRVERKERNRDDPFYIGVDDDSSGVSTPFHQALNASNGTELDIDSIPIIDLKLDDVQSYHQSSQGSRENVKAAKTFPRKYNIIPDEMIGADDVGLERVKAPNRPKRQLLQVDSSGLKSFTLGEEAAHPGSSGASPKAGHETEMAIAMKEVERVRLEMQRASERIQPKGIPAEGTMVKKKRRVKKSAVGQQRDTTGLSNKDDASLAIDNTQQQTRSQKSKTKKKVKGSQTEQ